MALGLKMGRFVRLTDLGSLDVEACEEVEDLLNNRHSFDFVEGHVRLRCREDDEGRQSLLEVVERLGEEPTEPDEVEHDDAPDDVVADFDPGGDAEDELGESSGEASGVDGGGQIVLSEDPSDLSLPATSSASMTCAVLARKGSGKSYFATVVCEEMMSANPDVSLVIVDPVGVFWGLLANADGSPSSDKILLLGGPRGHLSIRAADGRAAARATYELRPTPVVLDLSRMEPSDQHRFVADYCEGLLAEPHFPSHLVFDEADEFVPQQFRAGSTDQARCREVVERVVMRGRSRGIGATLTSLRPAVVSKNVLSQVDSLCLMCMVAPNDLRAVAGWLERLDHRVSAKQADECLGQLPILPVGTAYFLRGGEHSMFRRFKVRRKRTYDSSRTLVVGAADSSRLSTPGADVVATARSILFHVDDGGEL